MSLIRLLAALFRATPAACGAIAFGAMAVVGGAGAAKAQEADGPLQVEMNQSRLMKLPDGVATLVIGNPSIADGTMQGSGLLVLTGKSFGRTNLIALDHAGTVLVERELAVVRAPAAGDVVTVYRGPGGGRQTLNCDPRCEPSITIGDAPDVFDATLKQINERNTLAGQN